MPPPVSAAVPELSLSEMFLLMVLLSMLAVLPVERNSPPPLATAVLPDTVLLIMSNVLVRPEKPV